MAFSIATFPLLVLAAQTLLPEELVTESTSTSRTWCLKNVTELQRWRQCVGSLNGVTLSEEANDSGRIQNTQDSVAALDSTFEL